MPFSPVSPVKFFQQKKTCLDFTLGLLLVSSFCLVNRWHTTPCKPYLSYFIIVMEIWWPALSSNIKQEASVQKLNAGPVALPTSSWARLSERHLLHHHMHQHVCCVSLDMAYGACSDFTTRTACAQLCSTVRPHFAACPLGPWTSPPYFGWYSFVAHVVCQCPL